MLGTGYRCSVTALIAAILLRSAVGHDLGVHRLSGENPSGDPILHEIEGAFEVELPVRFNIIGNPGSFFTLFEYSSPANDDNTIWFGQEFSSDPNFRRSFLRVKVNGVVKDCAGPSNVLLDDSVYTFQFGVDAANIASVHQGGTKLFECPSFIPPINTARNHFLGEGTYDSLYSGVFSLDGAILGIRVTNLGQNQHPRDAYKFRNFPGQSFGSPLVASFYARFDSIILSRPFQRVFDFGNGAGVDNILCGQYLIFPDMMCEVHQGEITHRIIAFNAIVEGVFAFWHFGVDADGTYWIEKDGVRVSQPFSGILPVPVFRKDLRFGKSNFVGDANLDGVVLGLRLDRNIVS